MGNNIGKGGRVHSPRKVGYQLYSESIRSDSPPIPEVESDGQSSPKKENEPQETTNERQSTAQIENDPQETARVIRDLSSRRVVIRPYESNTLSELDLVVGEHLFKVEPAERTGWSFGAKRDGTYGYFPSRCVQPLTGSP